MFSKSLIQFSVDEQGCIPSALLDLRPNCGGGNEDKGDLLHKVPYMHCCTQCLPQASASPHLCWRLLDTHGHVWVNFLLSAHKLHTNYWVGQNVRLDFL